MCGPIVYPPVITSSEPEEECIFDTNASIFERLFEFGADVVSNFTVIVNGVVNFITDAATTFISWVFDSATTVFQTGLNIIRVVVENAVGSTERIIHSVITDTPVTSAPQITAKIPDQQAVSDVLGVSNTRTFGVTIDQPANIIFKVNSQEKSGQYGVTDATWECDFSAYSAGTYEVEVTATNSYGSDSFTWSWEIIEQPVITFVTPSSENVSNYDASDKRLFSASANIPCILELYFNDRLIEKTPSEVTEISHEFDLVPLGSHDVKIIAKKDDVQVERSWSWSVNEYSSSDVIYCESRHYSGSRLLHGDLADVERNLNFNSNMDLRCQKSQLPDGSWIYLFTCSNIGIVVDDDLEFPPIVINPSDSGENAYLGGFNTIELSLAETSGNENFVLFSSMDKFCIGIYPLKWGNFENYYKMQGDLEFILGLAGLIPAKIDIFHIGDIISGLLLWAPSDKPPEFESINYSFPYEATMELDGVSPTEGRSPYVENQFRWIAWVQKESSVKFSFLMKLIETNSEGEYFETNKEIQITAGNDPVVL